MLVQKYIKRIFDTTSIPQHAQHANHGLGEKKNAKWIEIPALIKNNTS